MTIPDNFKFRFGDEPQYTHHADQILDTGLYQITWDKLFVELNGVDWYECGVGEIEYFIAEHNGWEIIE